MVHIRFLGAIAALALPFATFRLGAVPEQEPGSTPRILVTNDDGIGAPGLRQLVAELSKVAEVYVSAPAENRSGSSRSITMLAESLSLREVEVEGATRAVSLSGTPTDAAAYGLCELAEDRPFDLLVSGINHGANVGAAAQYSGTVGAAMEGASRGVPSIAVSMDSRSVPADAAAFVARFVEQYLERGVDADVVYSINIPAGGADRWKGCRAADMGACYIAMDEFREVGQEEEGALVRCRMGLRRTFADGTDSQAYFGGFITVTPLVVDWTHRAALEELGDWDLELR